MTFTINRRLLLAGTGSLLVGCATGAGPKRSAECSSLEQDWQQAETIRQSIQAPQFAPRRYEVSAFGAKGDGRHDSSDSIRAAITACHREGGGRVVVPAGDYRTGPVHLLSNVELHLEEGARLRFYTDPERYLPAVFTRWEGMEFMGYSPLIYAFGQTNIAVTGPGQLDGQASREHWWPWKGEKGWEVPGLPTQHAGRKQLMQDVEAGVPPHQRHYSQDYYFRPPFIQFYRCSNVLIEGVHMVRSPFWLINPVLCDNVIVRRVRLESLGPNSDGCNPESCRNVLIEDCYFDTGDDCIAIKSGRNADGRRVAVPSENIVIRGCQMRAGHGGVVIGSEISGGARNIFIENCYMSSPDLERGIRIKTNSVRGGVVERIRVRNLVIGEVRDAIVINFHYEEGDAGEHDPIVRDVHIENLLCQRAQTVFQLRGFGRAKIQDVAVINAHFLEANPGVIEHVDGLKLENLTIAGQRFENPVSLAT